MPLHHYSFAIVLAVAIAGSWTSTAGAQTQSAPPRGSQPRAGQRTVPQQAPRTAANPRAQYPAPADATNRAAPPAANGAVAVLAAAAPPGFDLNPAQQNLLDQVLLRWEKQSEKVSTFTCKFKRWEIDPTFGPEQNNYTLSEADGTIQYRAPDRGEYEVTKVIRWDGEKLAYLPYSEGEEHWMCDGEAIYEWDRRNKKLKVRPLPPGMQGKAITDGPLPFIFGAKAQQLKRRYWMRDVTPAHDAGKMIWLEARPKFQQDAANFQRATVILNEKTFLPEALQIYPPGIAPAAGKAQANTAFRFHNPSVNNPLDIVKGAFSTPITPPFWTRVVVEAPDGEPEKPALPEGAAPQARRPAAPPSRK